MDHETIKTEGKKVLKAGYWVLIILALFLVVETLGSFKAWRTPEYAANTISVVGKGEAVTVPDIATFSFSVSADAKTVSAAQTAVTKKTDLILPQLKALGIEEKDIKTTDYNIYPKYSYIQETCTPNSICPPGRQTTDGYTVTHTILVKVRKTDDAGKALSVVGTKGATNVSGLSFTMDDPDKAANEARAAAIEDAKTKAEDLAKHLGVRLVRVVGYFDNANNPTPMYESMGSGNMKAGDTAAVAPTLPIGENKTTANVTVNYEIR